MYWRERGEVGRVYWRGRGEVVRCTGGGEVR